MTTRAGIFVALCTCNGRRFDSKQITSMLGQSLPADELVVFDDACEDATILRLVAAQAEHRARQPGATAVLRLTCLAASCSMLRSRNCWVEQAMPAMSAVWYGAWGMVCWCSR